MLMKQANGMTVGLMEQSRPIELVTSCVKQIGITSGFGQNRQ